MSAFDCPLWVSIGETQQYKSLIIAKECNEKCFLSVFWWMINLSDVGKFDSLDDSCCHYC